MSEEANAVLTKSPVTPCVVTSILVALTLASLCPAVARRGRFPDRTRIANHHIVSVSCNPLLSRSARLLNARRQ